MRKTVIVFIILIFASIAYSAKVVNITTTRIDGVRVEANHGGVATCVVDGSVFDSAGNLIKHETVTVKFEDLPSSVRNNLNNVMKHLSRELNNFGADEDSETWEDK